MQAGITLESPDNGLDTTPVFFMMQDPDGQILIDQYVANRYKKDPYQNLVCTCSKV